MPCPAVIDLLLLQHRAVQPSHRGCLGAAGKQQAAAPCVPAPQESHGC